MSESSPALVLILFGLFCGCIGSERVTDQPGVQSAASTIIPTTSVNPAQSAGSILRDLSGALADCANLSYKDEQDACMRDLAIRLNNDSICTIIRTTLYRDTCYMSFANRLNDQKYCEKVNLTDFKNMCLAWAFSNTSLCNDVGDGTYRAVCTEKIAVKKGDYALCGSIDSTQDVEACRINVALAKDDRAKCDSIDGPGKTFCYLSFAIAKKDPALCEPIATPSEKDFCYITLAVNTTDRSLCEKIADSAQKDYCQSYFVITSNDAEKCSKLNDSWARYECYAQSAAVEGTPLTCNNLGDENQRMLCLFRVATVKNDAAICDMITAENKTGELFHRARCRVDVATATKDIKLCDSVKLNDWKDYCISQLTDDLSVCNRLANNSFTCNLNIAIKTNNYGFCDTITIDWATLQNFTELASCYGTIAVARDNITLCDKIPKLGMAYEYSDCITSIVMKLNRPELCRKIDINPDKCLLEFAEKTGDRTTCEMISDFGYFKQLCYERT